MQDLTKVQIYAQLDSMMSRYNGTLNRVSSPAYKIHDIYIGGIGPLGKLWYNIAKGKTAEYATDNQIDAMLAAGRLWGDIINNSNVNSEWTLADRYSLDIFIGTNDDEESGPATEFPTEYTLFGIYSRNFGYYENSVVFSAPRDVLSIGNFRNTWTTAIHELGHGIGGLPENPQDFSFMLSGDQPDNKGNNVRMQAYGAQYTSMSNNKSAYQLNNSGNNSDVISSDFLHKDQFIDTNGQQVKEYVESYYKIFNPDTPMLFDMAFIDKYNPNGLNHSTRAGDDRYGYNVTFSYASGDGYTSTPNRLSDAYRAVYDYTNYFKIFGYAGHSELVNYTDVPIETIYDSNGNDTLDLSGIPSTPNKDVLGHDYIPYINLNEATFSDIGGLYHNLAMGISTIIDNYIGNDANEIVIGNEVANAFITGNGNDSVQGGLGADTLVWKPGEGNDWFESEPLRADNMDVIHVLNPQHTLEIGHFHPATTDWIFGGTIGRIEGVGAANLGSVTFTKVHEINVEGGNTSAGFEVKIKDDDNRDIYDILDNNTLIVNGGSGNDTVDFPVTSQTRVVANGNGGDDVLEGGAGSDILDGGTGKNIVSFTNAPGNVKANLEAGQAQNDGYGQADSITGFNGLIGSAVGSDQLIGTFFGDETIVGLGGNDLLIGDDDFDLTQMHIRVYGAGVLPVGLFLDDDQDRYLGTTTLPDIAGTDDPASQLLVDTVVTINPANTHWLGMHAGFTSGDTRIYRIELYEQAIDLSKGLVYKQGYGILPVGTNGLSPFYMVDDWLRAVNEGDYWFSLDDFLDPDQQPGDDILIGGSGSNTLTGGHGADTFIAGQGNDIVTDYVSGEDHVFEANSVTGQLISYNLPLPFQQAIKKFDFQNSPFAKGAGSGHIEVHAPNGQLLGPEVWREGGFIAAMAALTTGSQTVLHSFGGGGKKAEIDRKFPLQSELNWARQEASNGRRSKDQAHELCSKWRLINAYLIPQQRSRSAQPG